MRRLSVLAIVFTLAIGPNASILCHAWCAGDNRPPGCHKTLASVVAADCCDSPAPVLTAVFGTESRQEAVSPGQQASAVRHHAEAPAVARLFHRLEPLGLHANSPITILRI